VPTQFHMHNTELCGPYGPILVGSTHLAQNLSIRAATNKTRMIRWICYVVENTGCDPQELRQTCHCRNRHAPRQVTTGPNIHRTRPLTARTVVVLCLARDPAGRTAAEWSCNAVGDSIEADVARVVNDVPGAAVHAIAEDLRECEMNHRPSSLWH
jgi:hypothetical protein